MINRPGVKGVAIFLNSDLSLSEFTNLLKEQANKDPCEHCVENKYSEEAEVTKMGHEFF